MFGVSVLFAPGADLSGLTLRNIVPHRRVAHATIHDVHAALSSLGYAMLLYITPDIPRLPDHHQLAVSTHGAVLGGLPDDAADILLRVLHDDVNPYPRRS